MVRRPGISWTSGITAAPSGIVQGADVLGAFCYTGTFEIHAAHYGAKSVLGLDISAPAVEMARRNATLNNLSDRCTFEAVNAFDQLKQWSKEQKTWDVVMLDPPAFTKSREQVAKAGGFLVSSSCTSLVSPDLFIQTLKDAAKDAKRRVKQLCMQSQSLDHPIVWGLENTHYLKFVVLQIE